MSMYTLGLTVGLALLSWIAPQSSIAADMTGTVFDLKNPPSEIKDGVEISVFAPLILPDGTLERVGGRLSKNGAAIKTGNSDAAGFFRISVPAQPGQQLRTVIVEFKRAGFKSDPATQTLDGVVLFEHKPNVFNVTVPLPEQESVCCSHIGHTMQKPRCRLFHR